MLLNDHHNDGEASLLQGFIVLRVPHRQKDLSDERSGILFRERLTGAKLANCQEPSVLELRDLALQRLRNARKNAEHQTLLLPIIPNDLDHHHPKEFVMHIIITTLLIPAIPLFSGLCASAALKAPLSIL